MNTTLLTTIQFGNVQFHLRQHTSTFLDAGWDFVGESANGTDDIWWIDEGKDYLRLWWETPAIDY